MEEEFVMTRMNIPYLDLKKVTAQHGEEIQKAVAEVVGSGWYLQGERVKRFEANYARYIGTKHCIGVANGLDALMLTLKAYKELGRLKEGAEILVPANTFIATVLAITENGMKPVFIDIDEETLDMDATCLGKAINERTGAMMLVHLYGRCTYHESIKQFCETNNLILIEDNAQAHGCYYQEQRTGSLGHAGCHSFYPGKNLGALGDGGAVTTNDDELAATIRAIANYGFEEKYVARWQGRNSRLDEVQAAVLDVKLTYLDDDNRRRQALARTYYTNTNKGKVRLPSFLDGGQNVYHIFPVFIERRDELQQYLKEKGIGTLIHYPIPPHLQQCYPIWNKLQLPVTERLAQQELSIPLNPTMTDEEAIYVVEALNSFQKF